MSVPTASNAAPGMGFGALRRVIADGPLLAVDPWIVLCSSRPGSP